MSCLASLIFKVINHTPFTLFPMPFLCSVLVLQGMSHQLPVGTGFYSMRLGVMSYCHDRLIPFTTLGLNKLSSVSYLGHSVLCQQ